MVLSRVGKSRHTVDISANLLTTSTDDQLIVRDSPCFIQSTAMLYSIDKVYILFCKFKLNDKHIKKSS